MWRKETYGDLRTDWEINTNGIYKKNNTERKDLFGIQEESFIARSLYKIIENMEEVTRSVTLTN